MTRPGVEVSGSFELVEALWWMVCWEVGKVGLGIVFDPGNMFCGNVYIKEIAIV